jgi:hypothetical protein
MALTSNAYHNLSHDDFGFGSVMSLRGSSTVCQASQLLDDAINEKLS